MKYIYFYIYFLAISYTKTSFKHFVTSPVDANIFSDCKLVPLRYGGRAVGQHVQRVLTQKKPQYIFCTVL